MARSRQNVFEPGQPVMYKGVQAEYGSFQRQGKLHNIRIDKQLARRVNNRIIYQENVYAERQGKIFLRVKGTSLSRMYQTNQEAKSLLEVDY